MFSQNIVIDFFFLFKLKNTISSLKFVKQKWYCSSLSWWLLKLCSGWIGSIFSSRGVLFSLSVIVAHDSLMQTIVWSRNGCSLSVSLYISVCVLLQVFSSCSWCQAQSVCFMVSHNLFMSCCCVLLDCLCVFVVTLLKPPALVRSRPV